MTEIARGLEGVKFTETRLSKVDGLAGELTIAGFPLQELAPNASFEEVLFLLWYDRLPTASDLEALRESLASQRSLPPAAIAVLREAAGRRLPTMDAIRMTVDTVGLCEGEPHRGEGQVDVGCAVALVAHMPTIAAAYWRLRQGEEPIAPRADLGHAANYLAMLTGEVPHPEGARALETYFNAVVDHGMNASTFTARVIVSTRSDMVSAIVGALGALKGPLHGGAPGPALDMVFEIRERAGRSGDSVEQEAQAWAKDTLASGGRIMGFGHRIYKVRDPRADVLADAARRLFQGAGDSQLYQDALTVEQVMLKELEEYRPGRGIKTNVEFFTALILLGVGLPNEMFTPTFAISRVGGWTAHVLEQIKEDRLIRPDAVYVGPVDRKWMPVEKRG
ncbi:MAG TPA: citrate synthase/methylcitrate synthase [Anaerolineales bacterium]|nr:citrate synthase/methylcitrate synthase [Anaerolineales bacterium]